MIKAVLYDLDGVLVHAVDIHFEAFNMALVEVSNTKIEKGEEEDFNGLPTREKLRMLTELGRVNAEDHQLVWEKKQEHTIFAIKKHLFYDADKADLHIFTRGLGLKSACVTNSITDTAKLMLEHSGNLPHIQFLISNQMVKKPKPHGECYIRAMVRFGLQPDECLIVEDSSRGLAAAHATSAYVWRVKNSYDVTIAGFKTALSEMFGEDYLKELIIESLKNANL